MRKYSETTAPQAGERILVNGEFIKLPKSKRHKNYRSHYQTHINVSAAGITYTSIKAR